MLLIQQNYDTDSLNTAFLDHDDLDIGLNASDLFDEDDNDYEEYDDNDCQDSFDENSSNYIGKNKTF